MGDITVFKRSELKYLLNKDQRNHLEKALSEYLTPDKHGESTICNIYYDTPDYRLIRHSLEKPIYKEKMRLRSYGQVKSGNVVFLELKKKYDGIVYKRRIHITESETRDFISGEKSLPDNSQIGKEISHFVSVYPNLSAKVYLCYDRSAYFSKTDSNLRITFDRNIRYRTEDLYLSSPPGGKRIIDSDVSILEVKCADAMPLWLVKLLEENKIKRISFSKYGTAYNEMLKKRLEEKKGIYR